VLTSTGLQDVTRTRQNTEHFIVTAIRTSNPTKIKFQLSIKDFLFVVAVVIFLVVIFFWNN
jgi:hypothetical protein